MAIIQWNGSDLPEALRHLPPGRYVVERLDESPLLSPDEEEGLVQALESLHDGRGVEHEQVQARILKHTHR